LACIYMHSKTAGSTNQRWEIMEGKKLHLC
jgi:hypothetical protein